MQCDNCGCTVSSDNYAVMKNQRYCLTCILSKKQSTTTDKKTSTQQCQVCFNHKSEKDFEPRFSRRCKHERRSICNECVYKHVKESLKKMCTDDVRCPEIGCQVKFAYPAVQKILSSGFDNKLREKYDQFVTHRTLERMSEFIWCAHGCGSGQLNEGKDNNNIVTCVKCQQRTCFTHKTEWHEGLTCIQYEVQKNPESHASYSWISQNCKKCPKCAVRIQKSDGCDHMTCGKCRYEFCWSCLADYDAIRKNGNHYHAKRCKHYA